ncbi:MAG: hypothetical protein ACKV22_09795 [Bryobacteraceae bacterium]
MADVTIRGVKVILAEFDRSVTNLTEAFESELTAMVGTAQAAVLADLQKRLAMTRGVIDRTPANVRVLRKIDELLSAAMKRAGYQALVEEFVSTFNGSLPYFDEILDAISAALKTPLKAKWSKTDLAVFESQQLSSMDALASVVNGSATATKRKALTSIGALPYRDLVEQIVSGFGRAVPESAGLAETSQVMFYRTVTDRGFRQIEADLPAGTVRYFYEGPSDKLTRPFCKQLLARTKREPMTRAEIDKLDNGALPNVFISGGGFRCRHSWCVSTIEAEPKAA